MENMKPQLISLFAGIEGFGLAGELAGNAVSVDVVFEIFKAINKTEGWGNDEKQISNE